VLFKEKLNKREGITFFRAERISKRGVLLSGKNVKGWGREVGGDRRLLRGNPIFLE